MEFIGPVTPEACRPLLGKPVCVVLNDGGRYYGYVHAVEEDRLLLTANPERTGTPPGKKATKPHTRTKAVFPTSRYGYPGGILALDLALIAIVIPLPFLLI